MLNLMSNVKPEAKTGW